MKVSLNNDEGTTVPDVACFDLINNLWIKNWSPQNLLESCFVKPEACWIDYLLKLIISPSAKHRLWRRDSRNDREAISNYGCTSLQAIALLTLNRLPRNIVLSHQMNGHVVFEAMSYFKILPLIVICTCVAIIVREMNEKYKCIRDFYWLKIMSKISSIGNCVPKSKRPSFFHFVSTVCQ